jgi:Ca2+-binding RTX toxin-like protein
VSLAGTAGGGAAAGDVLTNIEVLEGSAFGDSLSGAAGNDTLFGNAGNDTLIGGAGADSINGGDGFDIASYANAAAAIRLALWDPSLNAGEAAGDIIQFTTEVILGSSFDDNIQGNASNNELRGAGGADLILGGFGDDTLVGGSGADDLGGGDGLDVASYAGGGAVRVALWNPALNSGDAAGDNIRADVEVVEGSLFNDTLEGSASANNLRGSNGSDRIAGGGGSDTLSGDLGNDTLDGGAGSDRLIGGGASDTFVFASGGGADAITDFLSGSSVIDVIRLQGFGAAFYSFAEVIAAAAQAGADTVITFGVGATLTLQNLALADLDADDFAFG